MKHLYGTFTDRQIECKKKALHSAIHWLLIDKENNYEYLDRYFESLLVQISGFNELLGCPVELVDLLSILQSAYTESKKSDNEFNFRKYKTMIFNAQSLVDKIKVGDE